VGITPGWQITVYLNVSLLSQWLVSGSGRQLLADCSAWLLFNIKKFTSGRQFLLQWDHELKKYVCSLIVDPKKWTFIKAKGVSHYQNPLRQTCQSLFPYLNRHSYTLNSNKVNFCVQEVETNPLFAAGMRYARRPRLAIRFYASDRIRELFHPHTKSWPEFFLNGRLKGCASVLLTVHMSVSKIHYVLTESNHGTKKEQVKR